jgi:hypothetical protein
MHYNIENFLATVNKFSENKTKQRFQGFTMTQRIAGHWNLTDTAYDAKNESLNNRIRFDEAVLSDCWYRYFSVICIGQKNLV